jgi:hypothetical protein
VFDRDGDDSRYLLDLVTRGSGEMEFIGAILLAVAVTVATEFLYRWREK